MRGPGGSTFGDAPAVLTTALLHREKQVLALVAMGYTNGEVAAKLCLAESTVKTHLSSCFDKLGVRSRREAAALVADESNGVGTRVVEITQEDHLSAGTT